MEDTLLLQDELHGASEYPVVCPPTDHSFDHLIQEDGNTFMLN